MLLALARKLVFTTDRVRADDWGSDYLIPIHRLSECTLGVIGMGSIVLNGAILEDGCMLGAGSLVTEGTVIPAGMLAFGRPAKAIRPVKPEEIEGQRQNIEHYLAMAKEHAGI